MFIVYWRIRKCQLSQLIMMCFLLSVIKVYWESLDSNVLGHVKSYSYRLVNNLDFISANLTISRKEALKFSDHRYLINHEQKCANRDVMLLLFVKSSPENFERRQAIRSTWGNEVYIERALGVTVRVLFALGRHPRPLDRKKLQQKLYSEDQRYQDLIQQDFIDSFHNLTIKLLLQFGWKHAYCRHARFLMSADDDIFVHLPNLIRYLREVDRAGVKDFWVGKVHRGAPPIRRKESKYYVSKEMYPWLLYPDYTPGAGYVVSSDVASRVYQASLTLNASLYIDDVFMGICANAMGISPQEHVFFSGEGRAPNHPCIYDQMMTSHGHVRDFHELWKHATDPQGLRLVHDRAGVKDFWVGKVHRGAPHIRRKESKYYVSKEIYPCPWLLYPYYTSSPATWLPGSTRPTPNTSLYIDDVFMSICGNAMGISH